MLATCETFELRKNELILFFEHLTRVEERGEFSIVFCEILHSNVLLMLYNLVEATLVGGIVEIYDAIKSNEHSYRLVNSEIQAIWFEFKFRQAYDTNAHHNSYKKKASQIIDAILDERVVELDRHAINAEGNFTAQSIRNICKAHGILFNVPPESRGGVQIDEVTALRNALAHGGKSFAECGRRFSISELKEIYTEIDGFLEGLLKGMTEYYNNQRWKCLS